MVKPGDINVLLVDDEENLRESVSINLELDGFKVFTANCGEKAIELLKSTHIDFVISDVRMPHGDGVSLLKYIKEKHPNLPHIVLVSGFAEISPDEVKELGGIDLLSKPFDIDKLVTMIKKYCHCN